MISDFLFNTFLALHRYSIQKKQMGGSQSQEIRNHTEANKSQHFNFSKKFIWSQTNSNNTSIVAHDVTGGICIGMPHQGFERQIQSHEEETTAVKMAHFFQNKLTLNPGIFERDEAYARQWIESSIQEFNKTSQEKASIGVIQGVSANFTDTTGINVHHLLPKQLPTK